MYTVDYLTKIKKTVQEALFSYISIRARENIAGGYGDERIPTMPRLISTLLIPSTALMLA